MAELIETASNWTRQREERSQQKAAESRLRKLEDLGSREPQVWAQVKGLIAQKQIKAYDEAVKLLCQLRELNSHLGQTESFSARLLEIQRENTSRPGLLWRLKDAGLVSETAAVK